VREGLGPLKNVVWDGNCCLHTRSITRYNLGSTSGCGNAKSPCVPACPNSVLEIRPLTAEDKRLLSLFGRLRARIHGNKQAYVVKADGCIACGRCVQACPTKHVIKLKRRISE
jgi:NAD-dependent dihydropyrimidine dehydrogenase PreA subunit